MCPIVPTNSGKALAFLVIALNPRRPYDDDYRQFINLVTQQVTTPQLSAVILREEVERRAALARQEALDRDRLSKELSEAETKFARFATRAPIGLAILGVDGLALSANGELRASNLSLHKFLHELFRLEKPVNASETVLRHLASVGVSQFFTGHKCTALLYRLNKHFLTLGDYYVEETELESPGFHSSMYIHAAF